MDLENAVSNPKVTVDEILNRCHTHEINKTRDYHGEYITLFPILKKYPDRLMGYIRMALATFQYILLHIEPFLIKKWCNLHTAIEPEQQLVVTLRFLATGASYSTLATSFRMGTSTVCTTVTKVMNVIWDTLQPIHMPVPSLSELKSVAEDFFKRWKFPHCIGAIDCRHMEVKKPPHARNLFGNWKKFDSIKLQAVVDANYRFLFVDAGDYGSNHDSTTFFHSALYEGLVFGVIKLPHDDKLPNSEIILPYCFIGDGAYMLMEHMMKPYRGKNLADWQKYFNKRLSVARVVVECAFGHLAQMWQIFHKMMEQSPETATLITKTCCLLRNVIIDLEGRTCDPASRNILTSERVLCGDDGNEDAEEFTVGGSVHVRNEFAKYFMKNPM